MSPPQPAVAFQSISHLGHKSMQAFLHISCDIYYNRPVSLLTWQKLSERLVVCGLAQCSLSRAPAKPPQFETDLSAKGFPEPLWKIYTDVTVVGRNT